MLGDAQMLLSEYMLVEDVNVINREELFSCPSLSVRIRYRSRPIPCKVTELSDGRLWSSLPKRLRLSLRDNLLCSMTETGF